MPLKRLDVSPLHRQFRNLDEVFAAFDLPPSGPQAEAVRLAYNTSYHNFGPYIAGVITHLVPDLWGDILRRPGRTKILRGGRDSLPLAAVMDGLCPGLSEHCIDAAISRPVSAAVWVDALRTGRVPATGRQPLIDPSYLKQTPPAGASKNFHRYLSNLGIPVDESNGQLVILDWSCGYGTTQEILASLYPNLEVLGRYFTVDPPEGQTAKDRSGYVVRPETKVLLNDGIPWYPRFTFTSKAVWAPQMLLSGPYRSAKTIDAAGPDAVLGGPHFDRINYVKIGEYADVKTWRASKVAMLLALFHYAQAVAQGREPVEELKVIRTGRDPLTRQVRAWMLPEPDYAIDPAFGQLLGAFVTDPRDERDVKELHDLLTEAGIDLASAMPLWDWMARQHSTGQGSDVARRVKEMGINHVLSILDHQAYRPDGSSWAASRRSPSRRGQVPEFPTRGATGDGVNDGPQVRRPATVIGQVSSGR